MRLWFYSLWLLFCYSIRSGILRSAELLQGHKFKHTASTSSTPSFERDQMFQLSPATSKGTCRKKTFRTCQLKTTAFWTIKVFTGISVDAVGLEASCLGSKWLQAMDIMATQLFARHITSANMMAKSSRRDIRDFAFVKLVQKNSSLLRAGDILSSINSQHSHGALKNWLTNDHRSSHQDMLATHCIFSFWSF